MKEMATNTVIDHLKVNDLPYDNLTLSESKNRDIADYAVIYTGGGRCIEFIVKCYGRSCKELKWYPYDKHGEKCPITSQ